MGPGVEVQPVYMTVVEGSGAVHICIACDLGAGVEVVTEYFPVLLLLIIFKTSN